MLQKAVVKDRSFGERLGISEGVINNWEVKLGNFIKSVANIVSSTGMGYAAAAGAYTSVSMFGTASTGTAISTLSGIAAKNATLAWFGGGAISAGGGGIALGTTVLGVVGVAPALFILGLRRKSSAEKFKTEVESKIAEMDIEEEKMRNHVGKVMIILSRISELEQSITKVNEKLKKLNLEVLLSNKFSMSSHSYEKQLYKLALTAKALSELLDQKII